MNQNIILIPPENYNFYLQSIQENDLENLRIWKNNHRASFFYKDIISPEQQLIWYQNYLKRETDYMFVLKDLSGNPVGCLGFRVLDNNIDLYNIIRGDKSAFHVSMKDAMHVMLNYIKEIYNFPIKCDVLKDNPAVNWYQKCGFVISQEIDYYIMTIDSSYVPEIKLTIEEA